MFLAVPLHDDTPKTGSEIVTYGLIAACVAVFLWQAGLPPRAAHRAVLEYGMVPAVLFGSARLPAAYHTLPPGATLVTSMFLHGGLLHLAGNMLYLWLFGRGAERALGPVRFLLLYLVSGVIAALAQAAAAPGAQVPMIGASGAIAGALGAYLLIYPRANVTVFIWLLIIVRLIVVPAMVLLGLWFGLQLYSGITADPQEPGVAFWAHVAGFIAGMVLVLPMRPRRTTLFQAPRSTAFTSTRPRTPNPWRGSVPPSGRRRGPWG